MTEPFLAEIRAFPFKYAPVGWALCDGAVLKVADHTALFSLVGAMYGGDGRTTFGLPDLRGRVPLCFGQAPGLSFYDEGQPAGVETVVVQASQMPSHHHGVQAAVFPASTGVPGPEVSLATASADLYSGNIASLQPMAEHTLEPAGGSYPHNNLQPYLTFNFCIALQGVFPPRPPQ